MNNSVQQKGLVLNIQRLSTEDGPGLRTTVFFKGCPLHCAWCHNPESINPRPQVHWLETRCIGCHKCIKACPLGALAAGESGIVIDRTKCNGCGECSCACPSGALELLGREYGVEELATELVRDRAFFEQSDQGGVTLSGGEPTLQFEFIQLLLLHLREEKLHTALDTCGVCRGNDLLQLLPLVDLVLYDLKLADNAAHLAWTGSGNQLILENLMRIADFIRAHGGQPHLWLRTPLIPGATADEGNLQVLGKFIAANLADVVDRWELCAFNNLCRDKYRRLELDWQFTDSDLLDQDELKHYEQVTRSSIGNAFPVAATGAARVQMETK